jgi:hypothetical protein
MHHPGLDMRMNREVHGRKSRLTPRFAGKLIVSLVVFGYKITVRQIESSMVY